MRVLFKVFPQRSHFNATFPLARALQRAGHEVVYAGLAPLRGQAEAQGFSYVVQPEDVFACVEQRPVDPAIGARRWVAGWRQDRISARALAARYVAMDPLGPVVAHIEPDIVLVDSPYAGFALSLARTKVRFGILESMVNLDAGADSPPLDTALVPTGRAWNRLLVRLHWWRYYANRRLAANLGRRVEHNPRVVMARAARMGANRSAINFRRYHHLGLTDAPELILSPQPLDFPRRLRPHQWYVRTGVDLNRSEAMSDYAFPARFRSLANARREGLPLVYCSLGTGAWRYRGAEQFLEKLIGAAIGAPWNLLLAVSTEFDPRRLPAAPNVAVFQVVPQLAVLRESDLMITHGGMNSLAECASLGVPMLVYPGSSDIDQPGNAARVVYHGLGLKGRMRSESAAGLRRKIATLLEDPRYRTRAAQMAETLRRDADPAGVAARFEVAFGLGSLQPHLCSAR